MPEFNLPNVKKENVSSSDLLKRSNLVVVFYRGAWCPYCNLYLKRLQGSLQDFKKNGGELVAISVENPDNSLSVAESSEVLNRVRQNRATMGICLMRDPDPALEARTLYRERFGLQ